MENIRVILLVIITLLISSCKDESGELPVIGDGVDGHVLAEFSSTINGDYPALENAVIDDLISDNPYIAVFPELIKKEDSSGLDRFIEESEAHGFDKQQFDVLYKAAIEVVRAIHIGLVDQATAPSTCIGCIDLRPSINTQGIVLESIDIIGTENLGSRGRNARYTFAVNQTIVLPDCSHGPSVCNIQIELFVIIHFPGQNFGVLLDVSGYDLSFDVMRISTPVFRVSNSLASLDLALNPEGSFTLSAGHYWMLGDDDSLATLETWTNEYTAFISSIKGEFTNEYISDSGQKEEVKVTGSVIGSIEEMSFFLNFSDSARVNPAIGSATGEMKGANLEVNFVTEAVER